MLTFFSSIFKKHMANFIKKWCYTHMLPTTILELFVAICLRHIFYKNIITLACIFYKLRKYQPVQHIWERAACILSIYKRLFQRGSILRKESSVCGVMLFVFMAYIIWSSNMQKERWGCLYGKFPCWHFSFTPKLAGTLEQRLTGKQGWLLFLFPKLALEN